MKIKFLLVCLIFSTGMTFGRAIDDKSGSIFKPLIEAGPLYPQHNNDTVICNPFKGLFGFKFSKVISFAKKLSQEIDPCGEDREGGAERFCKCVMNKKAKHISPYHELNKDELADIKKQILEKEKIKRLQRSLDTIGNIINSEMFGDAKVQGCSIDELRKSETLNNCSEEGKKLIIGQYIKEGADSNKSLRELLDDMMYRRILEVHENYAKQSKDRKTIISRDDFNKLVETDGAITSFLTPFERNTPVLLKEMFKVKDDQQVLAKLKSVLSIPENTWNNFFEITEDKNGHLGMKVRIKKNEIVEAMNGNNGAIKLNLYFGKQGGNAWESLEGFIDGDPEGASKLVDLIADGRVNIENYDSCSSAIKYLEKICTKKHDELVASDIVEQCFETKYSNNNPFSFSLQRYELAMCQTYSGLGDRGFFAYNEDLLGSSGANSDSISDTNSQIERCTPKVKNQLVLDPNKDLIPAASMVRGNIFPSKETNSAGRGGSRVSSQSSGAHASLAAANYIDSSKITHGINETVTASATQNIKDAENVIAPKANYVDKNKEWSMADFINGGDKANLPGENQWEKFKSQGNVPDQDLKSLERKYGDLKQEETVISSEEERLAKIEKELKVKEAELNKAQQAFEKTKDDDLKAKAKADLENLRKEVAGLQGELKSSQAEISKLRDNHQEKVQDFRSEVTRANSSFDDERVGNNIGTNRGSFSANNDERRLDNGAQGINSPVVAAANARITGRAAMAVTALAASGNKTGSANSTGATSSGSAAAAITLTSDVQNLSVYKGGEEITLDKQVYVVVNLANGEKGLQVKGSNKIFMPDKKNPKNLIPVDIDGKMILAKDSLTDKKDKAARAPASEKPKRRRDPFSVLKLNNALKD